MALERGIITQAAPTSTGTQDFTFGFEPKFAIVLMDDVTAAGLVETHMRMSIGAIAKNSGATTNQWAAQTQVNDAAPTMASAREIDTGVCAQLRTAGGTLLNVGVGAITATGIQIDWTTVQAGAPLCTVIAFGGDEIEDCDAVTFALPTVADSSFDVDVGFAPDFAFFASPHGGTLTGHVEFGHMSLGAYDGTNQWVTGVFDTDNVTTSNTYGAQRTNAVLLGFTTGNAIATVLAAVGFTSTGIELNADPVIGNARLSGVLMVKGTAQFKVGTLTQPATDTTLVVSPGFEVDTVFFASHGAAADDAVQDHWNLTYGVQLEDSSTDLISRNNTNQDNVGTSIVTSYLDDTKALRLRDPTGASDVGTMLITSVGATDFTTTWTSTDGTQRQVVYFAIGAAAAGGGGVTNTIVGSLLSGPHMSPIMNY